MKEIKGELWDYFNKPKTVVLITTNGSIKANGHGVMGRGCAAEAMRKFNFLPARLGAHLKAYGNVLYITTVHADESGPLGFFPVKHNWWEKADIRLIEKSAIALGELANRTSSWTYILPRPGCGNGHLAWEEVEAICLKHLPDNVWVISK